MKKIIYLASGIIIGMLLSIGVTAYAAKSTMVGKMIQGELSVLVNGKKLSKKAIVVDGTSYLPVKTVGESIDLDVKYDGKAGVVSLSDPIVITDEHVINYEGRLITKEEALNIISGLEQNKADMRNNIDHLKFMMQRKDTSAETKVAWQETINRSEELIMIMQNNQKILQDQLDQLAP